MFLYFFSKTGDGKQLDDVRFLVSCNLLLDCLAVASVRLWHSLINHNTVAHYLWSKTGTGDDDACDVQACQSKSIMLVKYQTAI